MLRKLTQAQRSCTVTEKNVWLEFQPYTERTNFEAVIEQASPKWLMDQLDRHDKLPKWTLKFQAFSEGARGTGLEA